MCSSDLELGGDPEQLLCTVGLDRVDPSDLDAWMSYRAWLNLLELSARELSCPHFGVLLARRQELSILGTVGFVMQQSPDVGTALRELVSYFGQHNQGAEVGLEVRDGLACLSFRVKEAGILGTRQQYAVSLGVGMNIMRMLCGRRWVPRAAYFVHEPPADTRPYREMAGCPIYFNWDVGMITFPRSDLDTPITSANEHLHTILASHLAVLQTEYPDDVTRQVKQLIRQALVHGDCSVDRVATSLLVDKRTLQRRLQAEGVTYQALLDDVRFEIATRYLLDSGGSLTNLADILCYSELSVFSNAFKARCGQSPRAWQRAQRQAMG